MKTTKILARHLSPWGAAWVGIGPQGEAIRLSSTLHQGGRLYTVEVNQKVAHFFGEIKELKAFLQSTYPATTWTESVLSESEVGSFTLHPMLFQPVRDPQGE